MAELINNCELVKFPHTSLGLYFSLSRSNFIPHKFWEATHFRLKFFIRTLIMPVETFKILHMLTRHPAYAELLMAQPRLPCRIHRPYLSTRISNKERVSAILHHYNVQTSFLGVDNFLKHISNDGLIIARFVTKDNTHYSLHYISTYRLDREGEASIILKNASGKMLSEISFTLCQRSGKNALIVGGLQGPNYQNAQDIIQQSTKNCHGLFPKRIVLEALTIVAHLQKVDEIYAVSNKAHVYRAMRYKNRTRHIHSDYDSFWDMSEGILQNDGHYILPVTIARKNIEEVASKKRAEYRRRFNLLDNMKAEILSALS